MEKLEAKWPKQDFKKSSYPPTPKKRFLKAHKNWETLDFMAENREGVWNSKKGEKTGFFVRAKQGRKKENY